jgi:PBP1b-binding outer membrane lipoprotein LpoB
MKRTLTIILASLMMLSCASCMGNNRNYPNEKEYSIAPADQISDLNLR